MKERGEKQKKRAKQAEQRGVCLSWLRVLACVTVSAWCSVYSDIRKGIYTCGVLAEQKVPVFFPQRKAALLYLSVLASGRKTSRFFFRVSHLRRLWDHL